MPVTLRASCIGSLAGETLKIEAPSQATGQVVNTFLSSFYVKTSSGELVFFTNRSLRSPITVNIDPAVSLDRITKPHDLLHLHGKQIDLSGAVIGLDHATSYEHRPASFDQLGSAIGKIREALRIVPFILSIIDTSQSALDRRGLTYDRVANFVNDGALALRNQGMENRFRETALKIIGLGFGLTPSGDDILGGFLAAYNALARGVRRSPILLEFPILQDRTSWISAKLLDYMQRLILDEELDLIIQTAAKGDADALTLALETLLPRGHTSGIDIATGAILALSVIRDIVIDEKETEVVAGKLGLL